MGDQTPVSVSNAVKNVLAEVNEQLPSGLSVVLRNDRSDIYRQRMGLLIKNGFMGLGLVFVLLALFLETRLAFWVALGIPISFLGSLLLLPTMDVSINMVSMFAFIVTLGIVVDDAIVVGENVYHHLSTRCSMVGSCRFGNQRNRHAGDLQRTDQHGGVSSHVLRSRDLGEGIQTNSGGCHQRVCDFADRMFFYSSGPRRPPKTPEKRVSSLGFTSGSSDSAMALSVWLSIDTVPCWSWPCAGDM